MIVKADVFWQNEDNLPKRDRKMSLQTRVHFRGILAGVFLISVLSYQVEASPTQTLKQMYDPFIKVHAQKHNIPADLVHSIIRAESNYNSRAISPKGAVGLMQLMPETAAQYGVQDRFDPEQNIKGGVRYLKDLCKLYDGNTKLVLAAYNAGQEALKKFSGIPPYPETKNYIQRVMKSYSKVTIPGSPPIYKFVNTSGTHVFTNDPYYILNNRKNKE